MFCHWWKDFFTLGWIQLIFFKFLLLSFSLYHSNVNWRVDGHGAKRTRRPGHFLCCHTLFIHTHSREPAHLQAKGDLVSIKQSRPPRLRWRCRRSHGKLQGENKVVGTVGSEKLHPRNHRCQRSRQRAFLFEDWCITGRGPKGPLGFSLFCQRLCPV